MDTTIKILPESLNVRVTVRDQEGNPIDARVYMKNPYSNEPFIGVEIDIDSLRRELAAAMRTDRDQGLNEYREEIANELLSNLRKLLLRNDLGTAKGEEK